MAENDVDRWKKSEELISLENQQWLNLVGQLEDVGTHEEISLYIGTATVTDMVFKNIAKERKLHIPIRSQAMDALMRT